MNLQIPHARLDVDLPMLPVGDPDPTTHLSGDLSLSGVPFHICAVRVTQENGCDAVDPALQNKIDAIRVYDDGWSNAYRTWKHQGCHYFVYIIPYQL